MAVISSRRGGFFEARGLLFGAAGEIVRSLGDLNRSCVHLLHAAGNRRKGVVQGFYGAVEIILKRLIARGDLLKLGGQ